MSYIDCFDHEYIGNLGYLPIYHPFVNIEGGKWGDSDFSATPQNLILGGGSGEHPAIVVHKLECLVAKFLDDQLGDEDEPEYGNDFLDQFFINYEEMFEFCGWKAGHFHNLVEMAKSTSFYSPIEDEFDLGEWLVKSLGELIFYSLPELNSQQEKLKKIYGNFEIAPTMQNVKCVPKGYPIQGGRRIIDGELKWGFHRF